MDLLHSRDDSFGLSSPSTPTDWRAKYNEAADMLAEARNELDDFIHSSKELEEELLRELERTEKTQQDLKDKISRLETDRDDWKGKYISLQTSHNTTVNSLHRERDTLRSEVQKLKVQLRDLELGNDDLERTERAISSSLADVEAKYAKALEEKIILEQELMNKAAVEEEAQRLRDDLRDANSEVQVLRDQLDQFKSTRSRKSLMTPPATDLTCSPKHDNSSTLNLSVSNEDQLLDTVAPADVLLADDGTASIVAPSTSSRPVSIASSSESNKPPPKPTFANSRNTPRLSASGLHSRSNSLRASPNKAAGSLPGRTSRVAPASRTTPSSAIPSRSKGVQMVSEMRAKKSYRTCFGSQDAFTMGKKKKSQLKPVVRGFATTSVPSKKVVAEAEALASAQGNEPGDPPDSTGPIDGPSQSLEVKDGLENKEDSELQALVDRLQDKTEREIGRTLKSLEVDRRMAKSYPRLEFPAFWREQVLHLIREEKKQQMSK
ncbi:NADH:ubiquinone oxidoreductase, partial [Serendipita sp. 399]